MSKRPLHRNELQKTSKALLYTAGLLTAAYVVAANHKNEAIAETKTVADRIHFRKVFADDGALSVSNITSRQTTFMLTFSRWTERRAEDGRSVCLTKSQGIRIPFTNVAYAQSTKGCGENNNAAETAYKRADTGYHFLYR